MCSCEENFTLDKNNIAFFPGKRFPDSKMIANPNHLLSFFALTAIAAAAASAAAAAAAAGTPA
jgi:hypothetical protein